MIIVEKATGKTLATGVNQKNISEEFSFDGKTFIITDIKDNKIIVEEKQVTVFCG